MIKGIVVFDLDGTIANINHRLHYIQKEPKDWESFFSKVSEDSPNPWAEGLIMALDHSGYFIVIVSGRPERTRFDTEKWLKQNQIPHHQLFLVRKDGDHSPDDLLKQKWLDAFEEKNDIEFVVDDRQCVVDMWRRNGLVCLQCYAWGGNQMKKKQSDAEKIKELERRIRELENAPKVFQPYKLPEVSPPSYPPYHPKWPDIYRCWCGRNYPHTCVWC